VHYIDKKLEDLMLELEKPDNDKKNEDSDDVRHALAMGRKGSIM
jgi:hypothetical protein